MDRIERRERHVLKVLFRGKKAKEIKLGICLAHFNNFLDPFPC